MCVSRAYSMRATFRRGYRKQWSRVIDGFRKIAFACAVNCAGCVCVARVSEKSGAEFISHARTRFCHIYRKQNFRTEFYRADYQALSGGPRCIVSLLERSRTNAGETEFFKGDPRNATPNVLLRRPLVTAHNYSTFRRQRKRIASGE